MSAQVGEFQHALAWNAANPLEIFVGNDSGLWRSTDAIGETGQVCAATDASHFQNLNGNLGSLAEVVSLSAVTTTPYTMMAGLGVNGTAGVKSSTATVDWPQILGGDGGPVAIDPINSANWYVNNQAGVSIYRCAQSEDCTSANFGSSPVVTDADVGGDGDTMPDAGAVSGRSARSDAIAGGNLPGVARAGQWKRLDRDERDQPDSRQRSHHGQLQRRCADSLNGRDGAAKAAANEFTWACTALPTAARTCRVMC